MSEPGSTRNGMNDEDSVPENGSGEDPRGIEGGTPRERVRTPVEPVYASIVFGVIAAIILGSMYFTQYSTPLFNLQLLMVILTVSLLSSVWLSNLIAGPGVAQLRGKVGDFAVDVGGPFAAFLATAVLLFFGHIYLLNQWWSQLPIQNQETLERLATVLEDYPPTELERVTAQYRYLLEGIGSNPDVKEIVELTNRSKQEKAFAHPNYRAVLLFLTGRGNRGRGQATVV